MSVKIRLARRGRRKLAMYDVVVSDSRKSRDGRCIEKLGNYNPNTNPATINIDDEKAFNWIMKGAQPTDTVKAMLSYRGVMLKKHLQIGVNKGAITQEEADKKFNEWLSTKESKIQSKVENLAKEKATKKKESFEAEKKVSDARAEERLKKSKAAEEALVKEIKENSGDGEEEVEEVEASKEDSENKKKEEDKS